MNWVLNHYRLADGTFVTEIIYDECRVTRILGYWNEYEMRQKIAAFHKATR